MAIELWRPRELESSWRAFDEMERAMDEWFGMRPVMSRRMRAAQEWMPPVEMYEKDNNFVIKAELPGVMKDDVDVSVTGHTLTIRGEKHASGEANREDYYLSEVYYGSFRRSIVLPESVDADKVEASFEDGTLMIEVPKMAESRPKKIHVAQKKKTEQIEYARGTSGKTEGRKVEIS